MFKLFDRFKVAITGFLIVALLSASGVALYKNHQVTKLEASAALLVGERDQLRKDLDTQKKINDDNALELDRLRKSSASTVKALESLDSQVKEEEKQFSALQKQVAKRLAAIEAFYAAQEPSKENLDRRSVEISLERSRGIWLLYCNAVPKAKECSDDQ